MKIGFVFDRLGDSKWYAPLVAEALERGDFVEVWINRQDLSKTTKWYEEPSEEKLPAFHSLHKPKFSSFLNKNELQKKVSETDLDFLFFRAVPAFEKDPLKPTRWLHLVSTFYDSVVVYSIDDWLKLDAVFCNTVLWKRNILEFFRSYSTETVSSEKMKRLEQKLIALGSPQIDHIAICDPEKTKKTLGLESEKRIVTLFAFEVAPSFWGQKIFSEHSRLKRFFSWLFLPFTYPYIQGRIGLQRFPLAVLKSIGDRIRYLPEIFRCPSQQDVLQMVSDFCKKNDATLIFKYRKKNPPNEKQTQLADHIILEDTDLFPYTSVQLARMSSLVFTFFSSAAVEAVAAGAKVINLKPDTMGFFTKDQYLFLRKKDAKTLTAYEEKFWYTDTNPGPFSFKKTIETISLRRLKQILESTSWDELVTREASPTLYLDQMLGPQTPSGPRILSFLKDSLLKQDPPSA